MSKHSEIDEYDAKVSLVKGIVNPLITTLWKLQLLNGVKHHLFAIGLRDYWRRNAKD